MKRFALVVIAASCAWAQSKGTPFAGRWDFTIPTQTGSSAAWLGITENNGTLAVWFQPTGGNVAPVKDFKLNGTHLTLLLSPALTWELDASGGKLTGTQKSREQVTALTGLRAPDLKRPAPKAWTDPVALFNGKNLDGWEPIGDRSNSHWIVKDGLLINEAHGANLRTTRAFDDFKLHFEVNCPDEANSGFYLRGRYEVQLEYEPLSKNPPERRIGSIYGRIAPKGDLPRTPGQWESFDVTLVGRTVTVVHNGITTIDRQEIEGITGGALDADEASPGPFYIQGDHTGGLKFRNVTVSVPKP
jgi:hypothetical protein